MQKTITIALKLCSFSVLSAGTRNSFVILIVSLQPKSGSAKKYSRFGKNIDFRKIFGALSCLIK